MNSDLSNRRRFITSLQVELGWATFVAGLVKSSVASLATAIQNHQPTCFQPPFSNHERLEKYESSDRPDFRIFRGLVGLRCVTALD